MEDSAERETLDNSVAMQIQAEYDATPVISDWAAGMLSVTNNNLDVSTDTHFL